jgi:cephalosporin-C deacetylase-like acetyl esterase
MLIRRIIGVLAILVLAWPLSAADAPKNELAEQLRKLDVTVVTDAEQAKKLGQMLSADARARIRATNQRETKLWQEIKSKVDWERFRDQRIKALRDTLGQPINVPKDLNLRVTRTIDGDGYKIENVVFESRPGLLVTGNLYSPKEPAKSMPGILICPSHHNPKTQGELQDMGMSWARLGCVVLVFDSLGHGERRAHPFIDDKSYPEKFKAGRQDYYFRYNTSLQLYAVGESLVGWMAWDLMRGVDLLLSRPGVDKQRILLLGSVAGGGDPAAVAAALDNRITAVGPFNFGGPQPETIFPLPTDAELAFNYAGGGSWESTRNIAFSVRDGFMPWVIVGAAAPRQLMYAHEFAWDKDRDPVWKRFEKIYGFYGVSDNLGSAHGKGAVTGKAGDDNTHCNNIGPPHRAAMYPALSRWLGIPFSLDKEYRTRHKPDELLCLTAESGLKPKSLAELTATLGAERGAAARQRLAGLSVDERRARLRAEWNKLLGDIEPKASKATVAGMSKVGDATAERIVLEVEPGIVVPALLLLPPRKEGAKLPVVLAFAQQGKQEFLKKQADAVAELLAGGTAVCLPDLRGIGETRPGDGRGRSSAATSISASELMLGQTLVGSRLRDLRSVLGYLRSRPEIDGKRMALWGDSFAPVNVAGANLAVPLDAEKLPNQAEPMGELVALLGALYEPDIKAVYARGGLTSYQALLHSQFVYLPHDAVVPGALTAGDLCDVAAAIAPRPLRLEGLVDGLNRPADADALAKAFEPTRSAYKAAGAANRLAVSVDAKGDAAKWLLAQLNGK